MNDIKNQIDNNQDICKKCEGHKEYYVQISILESFLEPFLVECEECKECYE